MIAVCGPYRYMTGLIKSGSSSIGSVKTWDQVHGTFEVFTPNTLERKEGEPIRYTKKTMDVSEFSRITLTITPGDIVQLEAIGYDGNEYFGEIGTESELKIKLQEPGWHQNTLAIMEEQERLENEERMRNISDAS